MDRNRSGHINALVHPRVVSIPETRARLRRRRVAQRCGESIIWFMQMHSEIKVLNTTRQVKRRSKDFEFFRIPQLNTIDTPVAVVRINFGFVTFRLKLFLATNVVYCVLGKVIAP